MRELLEIFESNEYSEFFFKVGVDTQPNRDNLLGKKSHIDNRINILHNTNYGIYKKYQLRYLIKDC